MAANGREGGTRTIPAPEHAHAPEPTPANGGESGVAFCDGRYVPVAEAKISVFDWGFARSDTTYDVVHVWKGRFFRLEDHLDRFERSCRTMRLDPGLDRDGLREVLMECVRRSGLRDAYVKLAVTRGQPAPGSRDPRTCRNTFFAFAVPFIWIFSPERQERGIHLILSSIPRIPPASVDPTAKNFHWGDLNRGLYEAHERGGDTVALSDLDGNVSEGPGFNVFRVQGGRVTTPVGTVLEGITRLTVQELCDELGVGFEYGTVSGRCPRRASARRTRRSCPRPRAGSSRSPASTTGSSPTARRDPSPRESVTSTGASTTRAGTALRSTTECVDRAPGAGMLVRHP